MFLSQFRAAKESTGLRGEPCPDPASDVIPTIWDSVLPSVNDGPKGLIYFKKVMTSTTDFKN